MPLTEKNMPSQSAIFSFVLLLTTTFFLFPFSTLALQERSYFLRCGTTLSATVDNRTFTSDNSNTGLFTASLTGSSAVVNPSPPAGVSSIYASARVFSSACWYAFDVRPNSSVFLRLHFLPFTSGGVNLVSASLQLSASGTFLLLRDFSVNNTNSPTVKEYLLWSNNDRLNLTFQPSPGKSSAFVNAIELLPAPTNFTNSTTVRPVGASDIRDWSRHAVETVYRANAGGPEIPRVGDSLWRLWGNDQSYLYNSNAAVANSTNATILFANELSSDVSTPDVAPKEVYRTLQEMNRGGGVNPNFNITWDLQVEAGYSYVVRLHFCDVVSVGDLVFNVFVNNQSGFGDLRPSVVTGKKNASFVPFFLDFTTEVSESGWIRISVGNSLSSSEETRNAILNGFEILKLNNSVGSLDGDENPFSNSQSSSKSSSNLVIIVASVAAAVVVIAALVVGYFVFRRRNRTRPAPERTGSTSAWTSLPVSHTAGSAASAAWGSQAINAGLRIPLADLRHATNKFDEKLVIGAGGFGKVYRGTMKDGTAVAIKCASPTSRQGFPEFKNEIMVLSEIRHRHLVSLVGFCDEDNEMILVYEFMSRGPFKDIIHKGSPPLSWTQRLEACIGAARGLHYLHTGFTHSIIHRDVKSSNILLDEDYVAKMADFGLSRVGPTPDQTHVSTAVKGSFGYLDPEYYRSQKLTQKSDVYSFGVVLFEALCGRAVIDPQLPRDEINLAEWASRKVKEGKVEEIIDPRIKGTAIAARSVRKFGEIAERCIAERGEDRPTIGDVLWSLEYTLQLQKAEENGAREDDSMVDAALPTVPTRRWEASSAVEGITGDELVDSNIFSQLITNEGR